MIHSISWTHCHIFLFTNNSRLFPDTGWEGWTWRWWARWGRPGVWVWRPRPRRATCRPPPPPWSRSQPRVSRRSIAAGNLGWTRRRWHLFSLSLSLTYTHSLPALHLGSATYPGPSVRQTKKQFPFASINISFVLSCFFHIYDMKENVSSMLDLLNCFSGKMNYQRKEKHGYEHRMLAGKIYNLFYLYLKHVCYIHNIH